MPRLTHDRPLPRVFPSPLRLDDDDLHLSSQPRRMKAGTSRSFCTRASNRCSRSNVCSRCLARYSKLEWASAKSTTTFSESEASIQHHARCSLSQYVCMYVFVCVCVCVCVCVRVCVCVLHKCIHMYTNVCMYMYMYIYARVCVYVCACMCV